MKTAATKNNFLHLSKEYSSIDNSGIILLPIQWSGENKSSGYVIKKIIDASRMLEVYDEEQGKELAFEKGISTIQTVILRNGSAEKKSAKIAEASRSFIKAQKFIVSISDSSCASIGLIDSYSKEFDNLSILHIGSKANLKNDAGSKNQRGSVMNKVAELNLNIVQVGIRSLSKSENEIRKGKKIRQFLASEIRLGMYGNEWQELVSQNLSENVYITIDLSVFDPSFIPNVEFPEPGGLFWDELLYLLKIVGQEKKIVGFDISGLKSDKNFQATYYFAAKLIYKILNYAF